MDTPEPKISILMPVYNAKDYLRECLDSIISQTFQEFEVICVDDGSCDNSYEILQEYKEKDNRFKILQQEHKGVGAARNLALSLAKSKYVQFLDSDDYFEPEMFEEMYNTAVKYDTDMVVCSAVKRTPTGEYLKYNKFHPINTELAIFNRPFNWKDCPDRIFSMFAPEPWQTLYKKDLLLNNNLFFPSLSLSNGAALAYIARICANKIVILDKAFINYRCSRSDSITSKSNPINKVMQLVELKEYLIRQNLYDELKSSYYQNLKKMLKAKCIYSNMFGSQYDEFCSALKSILGYDWKTYEHIIDHKEFAYERLKKLTKSNKIVFWGASRFLEDFVTRFQLNDDNILGIIDANQEKWGRFIGQYKIFAPEELDNLNPDCVVVSIINDSTKHVNNIKEYIRSNYKKHIDIEPILEEYKDE